VVWPATLRSNRWIQARSHEGSREGRSARVDPEVPGAAAGAGVSPGRRPAGDVVSG
jgi:hypothetical protein